MLSGPPFVLLIIGSLLLVTIIVITTLEFLHSVNLADENHDESGRPIYVEIKNKILDILDWSPIILGAFIFLAFLSLLVLSYLLVPSKRVLTEELKEIIINARPELIGAIFDLFLLFIFVEVVRERFARRKEIKDYVEQLSDYKKWHDNDARFRVAGIVKRLVKLNFDWKKLDLQELHIGNLPSEIIVYNLNKEHVKSTDFSYCNIRDGTLKDIMLEECRSVKSYFWNLHIYSGIIEDVDFSGSYFIGMTFMDVVFKNCNFTNCRFYGDIDHENVEFDECVFTDVQFQRPNLSSISFVSSVFTNVVFSSPDFSDCNLANTEFKNCGFIGNVNFDNAIITDFNWIKDMLESKRFGLDNLEREYKVSDMIIPDEIHSLPLFYFVLNKK
ncbi:pentapeptide repeat-containing protein [Neolewinella persica]|uniref:pentapeptide repeat-containing protein n=1 Tax=Neolewinella persica TaxID=70998 RepID=UPI0003787AF8|nr:pentapeptide repeat-containing protein [Neolewinella persica]